MKIEVWFDRTDWNIGFSWWRRRYGDVSLSITINLLMVKFELMFSRW